MFIIQSIFMVGCAYKVQPTSVRAINLYNQYEEKIPGLFGLVVDDTLKDIKREIKPSTYFCSAHVYPLDTGNSLISSIRTMVGSLFEQTTDLSSLHSFEKSEYKGIIYVRLIDFTPKLNFYPGFWSGSCAATTEISLEIVIRNQNEILFQTTSIGSKTAEGDAGSFCDKSGEVLAESITRATRDVLERIAERIANSSRLRKL
ncbi:MAG: hypothetical protein AB1641_14620 [Thermodesulfobacteriota bacterium]